jgi:lipopolysaccharide export LptBFGC system permease protein LptF
MNGLYGGMKKPIFRRIMSRTESAAVEQPSPAAVKAISALVGVLSLGVLVQAVTGGIFAREPKHKGLIDAHSGIAYLIAVLALAIAVVGFVMWRGRTGGQVVMAEAVALFVLVVVQIGIGQQIGDLNKGGTHPGLLAIHIPLALLIFGLSVHLSTFVANIRRQTAPS